MQSKRCTNPMTFYRKMLPALHILKVRRKPLPARPLPRAFCHPCFKASQKWGYPSLAPTLFQKNTTIFFLIFRIFFQLLHLVITSNLSLSHISHVRGKYCIIRWVHCKISQLPTFIEKDSIQKLSTENWFLREPNHPWAKALSLILAITRTSHNEDSAQGTRIRRILFRKALFLSRGLPCFTSVRTIIWTAWDRSEDCLIVTSWALLQPIRGTVTRSPCSSVTHPYQWMHVKSPLC